MVVQGWLVAGSLVWWCACSVPARTNCWEVGGSLSHQSQMALLVSLALRFLYRFTAGRIIFLIEYAEIRDVARALVSNNLGIPLLSHILSNSLVIEVFGIGSAILRKR